MTSRDLYAVLDVPPDATQEEIQNAYRQLALTLHPDVSKAVDAEDRMKEINAVYEVLSDPEKRRQYDLKLAIKEPLPVRPDRHRGNTGHPPHESSPDQAPVHRKHWDPLPYKPAPRSVSRQRSSWPQRGLLYQAGMLVILFILVVMWLGTSQTITEKPVVNLQGSPVLLPQVVSEITPWPPVTAKKTFEDWKSEGDGYAGQGKTRDAISAYTRALKLQPNVSSLWATQGDLYSMLGYFDNAVTCYDRALATDPQAGGNLQKKISILSRADVLMDNAELAVRQENYPAAIGIYDDILSVDIRNTNFQKRVLSAKVYALMRAGMFDEATRVSRLITTV